MEVKRHSPAEVVQKLRQAHDLEQQGESQRNISRALGVSVMTLHRWKKQTSHANSAQNPPQHEEFGDLRGDLRGELVELRNENRELRRMVLELLREMTPGSARKASDH